MSKQIDTFNYDNLQQQQENIFIIKWALLARRYTYFLKMSYLDTLPSPFHAEERMSLNNFYKYFRNLNSTSSSSNSSSTSETVLGPAGINYCPIL